MEKMYMMKRWCPCMGCMAQWRGGTRGPAHHQEGGVDSFLAPSQESEWTHQGPCGQQDDNRWVTKKVKKECIKPRAGDADLWIKTWEELHELVKKMHPGGSGTCEGTPHKEGTMTQLERFVTEGNKKADDLAKAGSNAGRRNCGRSESINCEAGERGGVCSFAVCGQLPLLGRGMERL